ncbi:conserved phage C-terminal domain-containing protein [Neobacillus sp. Marseille-QA0830]
MSKLLIDEAPIMIIPSLAAKIGLNEAIVLQQIHYWVQTSSHVIEGKRWIYNTYKEWQKQMPFWSESTIKRIILSLEERGFLLSANWNKIKLDKTKWYTIDYQRVESLAKVPASDTTQLQAEPDPFEISVPSSVQADPSEILEWAIGESELTQAIPEITSEITTEKILPIVDIVDYLNEQTNANYKSTTKKTRQLIKARCKEGFTLKDFKKVIDLKTVEWLNDRHMSQYLRPETLFGTKFEAYLNQKSTGTPYFEPSRGVPITARRGTTYQEEDFDLDD